MQKNFLGALSFTPNRHFSLAPHTEGGSARMADPAFSTASGGFVFVDDDDDEIVDELLKLEGDLPGLESAAKVNTQIKLCIMLLCLLPILGMLIILSWRQYGARINDLQRTQRSPAVDKKQS